MAGDNKRGYKDDNYSQNYRESHRELYREAARKRYWANRERILEEQRLRYIADADQRKARQREYNRSHSEAINNQKRFIKYGISPDAYASLLAEQGGGCAICQRQPPPRLHIDHSHRE